MLIAPQEFDALVILLHSDPQSPATRAARAVLVDGMTQGDAMRAMGITRSAVWNSVTRYRDADGLIRQAYGLQPERSVPVDDRQLWTVVRFPDGSWAVADNPNDPLYAQCEMWEVPSSTAESAVSVAQMRRGRARKKRWRESD